MTENKLIPRSNSQYFYLARSRVCAICNLKFAVDFRGGREVVQSVKGMNYELPYDTNTSTALPPSHNTSKFVEQTGINIGYATCESRDGH
jgi:hypothetical protein